MAISITMEEPGGGSSSSAPLIHPRYHSFLLAKSKLGGVGLFRLMALIGGFCVSAVAELKGHETAPPWLLTLFTVTTVLLTSVAAFVILFTAWLLPYLSANEELDGVLLSTGLFRRFPSHRLYYLQHGLERMVQVTWHLASTVTVLLFLIDMILISWIKFQGISGNIPPSAGTSILSPTILLILYLAIRFWKELLNRKLFGGNGMTQEEELQESLFMQRIQAGTPRPGLQGPGVPGREPKRKCSDGHEQIEMSPLGPAH